MKSIIKSVLKKLPFVGKIYHDHVILSENACYKPGHFYSPIVDVKEIKKREDVIWSYRNALSIPGIELNLDEQLKLVEKFYQYYQDIPFKDLKSENLRFYFDNTYYSYTDASVLYFMIRHFQPKRIVEVGSGYSSAVMLDTNELFFDNNINLTFVEPYSDRLKGLLKFGDNKFVNLLEAKVQTVDLNVFMQLEAGDILFIDSSHVSKTDSDLNHLLFVVLPILKPGVLIHFHDIFYPFEYPASWVLGGRNWNEDYLLRSFLMYNSNFKIEFFADYLHHHYGSCFDKMPILYKNTGGCMWLRKMAG